LSTSRGITETGSILDRIVAELQETLAGSKRDEPEAALRQRFADYDPQWQLSRAISAPRGNAPGPETVQIIAELKKASPSKGLLADKLDAVGIARAYLAGGATGISVVTEPNYFRGEIRWLKDVRLTLGREALDARPSLLRKDFVTDPYELVQARAYGADNVLLIVAMLDVPLLRDLLAQAGELDLDALVEVHSESEAERALEAGARLFGINNRDLHTFNVDLGVTERIRPLLPRDALVVGESGVHSRADVERLQQAGVRAVLVGEAFMTAPDIGAKMAELRPEAEQGSSR
jgi:indole-3-glycerol phosphate synthase